MSALSCGVDMGSTSVKVPLVDECWPPGLDLGSSNPVEMPKDASAEESLVYSQLTKIVAEIEAMAIEAGLQVGQVA
jgi:hypothetical protein